KFALLAALIWIFIGTFSLIDLQVGQRLYFSVTSYDYTKNISVTDAITRTGVPPVNPSFRPGYDVPLFYYYFWFMMCSLVDRVGGALVDARGAVFGATLWGGLALMAIVALALRFLHPNDQLNIHTRALTGIALLGIIGLDIFAITAETAMSFALMPIIALELRVPHPNDHLNIHTRTLTGIALLGITGLDISAITAQTAMSFALGLREFRSDLEWWNEQVTAWADAALFVPHH